MRRRRLKYRAAGALLLGLMAGIAGRYLFLRPSDQQLLQSAIRFADRGESEAAIALFDEVLKRNPTESTALLYRGQLARDLGDREAAGRFWKRVPEQPAREGATARYLEGSLFLEASRARPAEAAFLKAIALNPAYLRPHERLLKLYVAQLRAEDIRRELVVIRRFRAWTPEELYQFVNLTGQVTSKEPAIPRVEQFVEADPDDVHSLVALGRYYLWDERYAEAARVLKQARSQSPDDASIRAWMAEALLGLSDLAAAREALLGALAGPDAEPCIWTSHGLFWMAVGEWRPAAACLRRAVMLAPGELKAVYNLGIALERGGDATAAQQQFRQAELLLQLRSAMIHLTEWGRRRSPAVPFDTVMEAGLLLMKMNRNAEAVPLFEQALAWNPASTAARENYRRALEESGKSGPPPRDGVVFDNARRDLEVARLAAADADSRSSGTSQIPVGKQWPPLVHLVDRHQEAALEFQYFNAETGFNYVLETTGGGVAVVDYDGDGWPDLYFPQGCRIPFDRADITFTDRLFRNLGNGLFADATAGSRLADNQYSQGCAAGDYNNDGFPDLAVANFGNNVLYRNNGDGTLTDVTEGSAIRGDQWSTSLAWGDVNRDGSLDLYVVNYLVDPLRACRNDSGVAAPCHPQSFAAEDDILYLNRGDGAFEDITRAADILAANGRGLGVVIADLDDDGWPDIYVANDGDPSFLFRNSGSKAGPAVMFAEKGLASGSAVDAAGNARAAMGIACADLDGDGRLDLYVTNFYQEADTLYLNRGVLLFEEAAFRGGLAGSTRLMLGWGAQAIDFDLDGRPELFLTNGHLDDRRSEGIPWKMPSQLFYNRGEGRFTEISRASGEFFEVEALGRGVARLDWDRDGRPDVVVVYQDRPAALLRNETPATGHRLILELHGVESNRDAIGARIRATSAGTTQILEICGGDGFLATNERRQIVGIGGATTVADLEIQWPSGCKDHWQAIPADSDLLLIEGRPPQIKRIDIDIDIDAERSRS